MLPFATNLSKNATTIVRCQDYTAELILRYLKKNDLGRFDKNLEL